MIYYVRHGETDFNLYDITQGNTNTSLNRTGLRQAQELSQKLKDYKFDYVFSSTLNRAIQTAEYICEYHDNEIITDIRLCEVCKGEFQCTIRYRTEYKEYQADPHKFGGETKEDVYKRVKSFMESIEHLRGKNILIVSHGGVFNYLLAYLNNEVVTNKTQFTCHLENCEVVELDF